MNGTQSWAERRREDAAAKAELLDRRRRAENERARAMLTAFVAAAERSGPEPEPLRLQDYNGRGTARTDVSGWYLRRDRTVAVGTDGQFYILTGKLSLADRLRGAEVAPSDPPLVIGASGKDGDSIALDVALDRVQPAWRSSTG
ncbi:hypothetical protein GCM10023169_11610 [Georgenia halophila]|uniref:Uncharacterized protein n=1 Tax=Georgenia halophila TaxID=620889 RepID=A0ABP8L235_9MICO